MRVALHRDVESFASLARPFLLEHEAAHCLPLGILDTLVTDPSRYPTAYLFSVHSGDDVAGIAWRTPPHPLGLTSMPSDGIVELVRLCAKTDQDVSGVVGPPAEAEAFARLWCGATGARVVSTMRQAVHQLDHIEQRGTAAGSMRFASEADHALLVEWTLAFMQDCGLPAVRDEAVAQARIAIEQQSRVLWEHEGRAVSMAGFGGKTPSGIRVSYVYTPPSDRGRGFASSVVTELTQHLLAGGPRFCFLYTDLANPTSNHIYRRIGYRPIAESVHLCFEPAP
jgi:predicted GNAT family acetyltransferase